MIVKETMVMDTLIWIGIGLAIVIIIQWLKAIGLQYTPKYKPNKLQNIMVEETKEESCTTSTQSLLIDTLRRLNWQYEMEGDNLINVNYQGESFRFFYKGGRYIVHIQDCLWYEAPLDDINNLSILHRAVNECNMSGFNRLVYTYYNDVNKVGVHTLREVIFMPQIPDLDNYLRVTLNDMLYEHQRFYGWMENIRREEYANL